jgi:hypothetical protein
MFKKIMLVALATVVLAPLANADSVRYGYRLDNTSGQDGWDQNSFQIDYMHQTKIENFRVGLGFRRGERVKDNRLTNRYQLRFQNRNLMGVDGFHLSYQIGTKERSKKDMTEYGQVQLQYGQRFKDGGSNFGYKVAYVYREGIFSGDKSTDYYHGPRFQLTYRHSWLWRSSIQFDHQNRTDGETRNRIGYRIQRNF